MRRKCKPGDRVRIVQGTGNAGKIVIVVRKYRGENVGGAIWHEEVFPWVVTSVSGLLNCRDHRTNALLPPVMTIVIDDMYLEPLPDDDDGLNMSIHIEKPCVAEV